jgi:hypothetical protein
MSTLATSVLSLVICLITLFTLTSLGITVTFFGGLGVALLSSITALGVAGGINNVE